MTVINVAKSILPNGMTSYDLSLEGVPPQFLGLAADLVFEGDFGAADYRGMEWGPAILAVPEEERPIQMVRALPGQSRIVLGLTFRADDLAVAKDGVWARFVFGRDLVRPVSIENRVFSIYQGGRRDLSNVEWTISAGPSLAEVPVKGIAVAAPDGTGVFSLAAEDVQVGAEVPAAGLGLGQLESNWEQSALLEAMSLPRNSAVQQWFGLWLFWPVLLGLLLLGWFYYRRRQLREGAGKESGLA
jgi:hypothetical protein